MSTRDSLVILKYLESAGEADRDVVRIPCSGHGTDTETDRRLWGRRNRLERFLSLRESSMEALAALMITYASAHGICEHCIWKI